MEVKLSAGISDPFLNYKLQLNPLSKDEAEVVEIDLPEFEKKYNTLYFRCV